MPLSTNLVAAWELNEASGNGIDSIGSNNLTNNNSVSSGTGLIYSNARNFVASSSQSLSCIDSASLSLGLNQSFTIEAWVKKANAGVGVVIANKGNVTGAGDEYLLWLGTGSRFEGYIGNGSTTANVNDTSTTPAVGSWAQAIFWYDSALQIIGITTNAGTAATTSWTGGTQDSSFGFAIGARGSDHASAFIDGLIGPVRFWKRALTSAERTELYNSGSGRDLSYITASSGLNLDIVQQQRKTQGIF